MALAPIWTMRPMSNFNLPDLPLLQLSPDASGDWDAVSWSGAILGGLMFGLGTDQVNFIRTAPFAAKIQGTCVLLV